MMHFCISPRIPRLRRLAQGIKNAVRKFAHHHLKPSPMLDTQDLTTAVFAKTPLGQQEIQSRSLRLLPLIRRILVLIDGKRSYTDLAVLVPEGSDVGQMIRELLTQGCVQVLSIAKAPSAASAAPAQAGGATGAAAAPQARAIDGLPPARARTGNDNEMARNFMINSVNAIIGQGLRISLIHDIFHSDTTEKLREVYFAWEASMSNHGMGARRLPELRPKLFKVL
jgi:hypothetical protein